jgi:hypothetical protein
LLERLTSLPLVTTPQKVFPVQRFAVQPLGGLGRCLLLTIVLE